MCVCVLLLLLMLLLLLLMCCDGSLTQSNMLVFKLGSVGYHPIRFTLVFSMFEYLYQH